MQGKKKSSSEGKKGKDFSAKPMFIHVERKEILDWQGEKGKSLLLPI